ncbi:CHL4-domain-containing protein [Rhizodiscina lignyota]|uniref:CHL4-domain-containing protein n=1 Tax=Rhizodiscina lignyota TaxID=1504668 RepID=A0A9P4IKU2_9PEZI|nr:CHL4-domain-containing protein [Rhizodiscina lignyota]
MAPRARLSVPTNAALSHSHRLSPSNRDVYKALSRLSRPSLLSLALEWLSDSNLQHCLPYTLADEDQDDADDEDAPYSAAQSIEELTEIYEELRGRKDSKREIIDRIMEGDWRRGISLYQLAMAETRYVMEHQSSQKWHALRLTSIRDDDSGHDTEKREEEELPRFRQQTFLQNLQREIGPFAKAHHYFMRDEELRISLLRVQLYDLPYNSSQALQDVALAKRGPSEGAKSVYAVFPDATAYVYVSLGSSSNQPGTDGKSLQRIVIDAIPKALSRPQARYTLKTTALSAKSLPSLLALRGSGRSNTASGGWSIFVEDSKGSNALDYAESASNDILTPADNKENMQHGEKRRLETIGETNDVQNRKRWKRIAEGRFGRPGLECDGHGIERFEVRIDDAFPKSDDGKTIVSRKRDQPEDRIDGSHQKVVTKTSSKSGRKKRPSLLDKTQNDEMDESREANSTWKPDVRILFHGAHVFAGIRKLVEQGVVDGEKMPGWMTGEAGVSIGVVKHGRMMAKTDAAL